MSEGAGHRAGRQSPDGGLAVALPSPADGAKGLASDLYQRLAECE
jgi:hypothetical protein